MGLPHCRNVGYKCQGSNSYESERGVSNYWRPIRVNYQCYVLSGTLNLLENLESTCQSSKDRQS